MCSQGSSLARWHPSTNTSTSLVTSSRVVGEAQSLVPAPSEMRHWRRGESDSVAGNYRQASVAETLDIIERIEQKTLKWTVLDHLYAAKKTRVSCGTFAQVFLWQGRDCEACGAQRAERVQDNGCSSPGQQVHCRPAVSRSPNLCRLRATHRPLLLTGPH